MKSRPKILGQLLVDAGHLTQQRLDEALGPGRRPGERIGETLRRMKIVTGEEVAEALAVQLGIPFAARPLVPASDAIDAVIGALARTRQILPLAIDARAIRVAMADPLDLAAIDDVRFQTGRRVLPLAASVESVLDALEVHYPTDFSELLDALPDDLKHQTSDPRAALEEATRRAPVVRLVDQILRSAIDDGVSDVHVEETGGDVRVRVRIDGRLQQRVDLPAASRRAVLSRLKVLAGMDIAVRRRAQDGRIELRHEGRRLTLRVSTLPVNGGEKCVVRILDAGAAPRSLSALGMTSADLAAIRGLVDHEEGVILAAGPTGSGKSTTLFAAMSEIDRAVRNVVTVEDPVEYNLSGANQVQVDRRAGLGFADALRAILRQDPDVVMVGEIRDRETAEIAMAAAVTGHLVLSTIHAIDAPGAIIRLLNMGVPAFLVAGGLSGVVAQRLVRRRCGLCHGRGCGACHDGCRGRTGVYEVLTVGDALRDAICEGAPSGALRKIAAETGMRTLAMDARLAVTTGLTTPHEAARLIHTGADAGRPCEGCGGSMPLGALACPSCGRRHGGRCECGGTIESRWRFCPWCVRQIAA